MLPPDPMACGREYALADSQDLSDSGVGGLVPYEVFYLLDSTHRDDLCSLAEARSVTHHGLRG